MAQIKTGTVSVTNGSNTVTGSGTAWLTDGVQAGDGFVLQTSSGVTGAGVYYTVAGVASNTSLTLTANWGGATASGAAYVIIPDFIAPGYPQLLPGDLEVKPIINQNVQKILNQVNANQDALGNVATLDTGVQPTNVPTINDLLSEGVELRTSGLFPTLSSDNLYNRHRIYDAADGMTDTTFHTLWSVTRASTKTYVGADGLIRTAAADTLPVSYDPETLKPVGRIVEEARTNILLWTEDFSAAPWATGNTNDVTVTNNAEDYNGTNRGCNIVSTAAGGKLAQVATAEDGADYVGSVYVRANTLSGSVLVNFINLSNTDITSQLVVGEWVKIELSANADSTTGRFYIVFSDSGADINICFPQSEKGSTPSSYIPTTSAQVTRSGDGLTRQTSGEVNLNEGTIYLEYVNTHNDGQVSFLGTLSDGTLNNSLQLLKNNSGLTAYDYLELRYDNTSEFFATYTSPILGKVKLAFTWDSEGNYRVSRNGGTPLLRTGRPISDKAMSELSIMSRFNAKQPNESIKDFRLYPFALTATELQAITS